MPPKKIPKKPRVVAQKQRQKQRQTVTQNVIINQEKPRRTRGPNKPKQESGGGGGGGQGPNQPPQIPSIQYQMNAPPPPPPGDNAAIAQHVLNLLQRPQSIIAEIPNEFNPIRMYRNPLSQRPFSDILNREDFVPEERPLPQFDRSPPPPNPILPDIVEDQNNIIMSSSSTPVAIPIASSSYIPLGFSSNQSINQLPSVNSQVNAYKDFGGNDAQQQQPDIYYEKRVNQERFYKELSLQIPSGTFSPRSTSSEPIPKQKSNKGRPFTALSEDDKDALNLYLDYKDRQDKRQFSSTELYKRGRKLATQNKSNNPEVMQFIADRSKKA